MPKLNKNNIELNFIWFGGAMPTAQIDNFVDIMVKNREVLIQLWVDSPETYSVLSKQIAKSISRYKLEQGNRYQNLRPRRISELTLPDFILPYIAKLQEIKLYPALSDLTRHFVLSRPKEKDGRPVRGYFEADNKLEDNLWQHLQGKQVALMYVDVLDGEVQFPPSAIRTDFIFLDTESPLGAKLHNNIREHLRTLVSDPILSVCLLELNIHASEFGTLNRLDLIDTYGWITPAVFWLEYLSENPDKIYGMQDILISREASSRAIKFAYFNDPERHWSTRGEQIPSLVSGLVRDVFRAVLADRIDKSRKILRSVLNELGPKYKILGEPQYFTNLKEFMGVVRIYLETATTSDQLQYLKGAIMQEFFPPSAPSRLVPF